MQEFEFLEQYNKEAFDRPSVAVDLVLFSVIKNKLSVMLIPRDSHPFLGKLSLAGTFVAMDESIDSAVERCLNQKMKLSGIYFEQLYTWGEVDRDPRMRIISVSYYALVSEQKLLSIDPAGDILENFYSVDELLDGGTELAFDHKKIISYGRERIRAKVMYSDVAFELLPADFTLPELQTVYEILLGKSLYKANFRKKIADRITPTDRMTSPNGHRPSRIYNLRQKEEQKF